MTRRTLVTRLVLTIRTIGVTIAQLRILHTLVRCRIGKALTLGPTRWAHTLTTLERGLVTSIRTIEVFVAVVRGVNAVARRATTKFMSWTSECGT